MRRPSREQTIAPERPAVSDRLTGQRPPGTARRRAAALLLLAALSSAAQAATLRWAARGDAESMDPHALLEGVTNNLNQLTHDALVERDREQRFVPALALRWTQLGPTRWRFDLRPGVRFHDGTPMTADDVVFSILRAQQPTSQFALYARPLGMPVAVDPLTVELRLSAPNPLLLHHAAGVMVMSRAWATAHRSERVPDFKAREESASSRAANGTGRWRLVQREPGVRTVLARHTQHWDRGFAAAGSPPSAVSATTMPRPASAATALPGPASAGEGLPGPASPAPTVVERLEFRPIANDATRTAALLAGDIDLAQDVPLQDLDRLEADPRVRLAAGVENRVVWLGFDVARDELRYGSVKDRNPFKDRRVREAFALAIDTGALQRGIMRGRSQPTRCMAVAAAGCEVPALEQPLVPDPARARRLLAEAGLADGFEVTLDCPNDRYVNDRALCTAVVPMLARIGVRLTVDARSKTVYFPKVQSRDTSFFMNGWGGSTTDAQLLMDVILHSPDEARRKGGSNGGGLADAELDRLIDAAAEDADPDRRAGLIAAVQRRVAAEHFVVPLHRQMLVWAVRAPLEVVVTPNNLLRPDWVQLGPR